jgi:hypothetical protein
MFIRALRNTFLKTGAIDSSSDSGKVSIALNRELDVNWILPDRHQHNRIELKTPINGRFTWFVYAPHWFGALSDRAIENVPYFAQLDSNSEGYRQCFAHSVFMAICALKPELINHAKRSGFSQPENYYLSKLRPFGDTTDNQAHVRCLRQVFNIDAYFTMTASPADLQSAIALGVPVPIGVAFKASGHWILLKGIENGNYIVNDPFGARSGSSDRYALHSCDRGREGENDVYTPAIMDQVFWDGGRDAGWAIFITAIDGKNTGVPKNL